MLLATSDWGLGLLARAGRLREMIEAAMAGDPWAISCIVCTMVYATYRFVVGRLQK